MRRLRALFGIAENEDENKVKKYAGLTEKQWRKTIVWTLTTHLFTAGYKAAWCKRQMYQLEIAGDWEKFPADLKHNIGFYAFMADKLSLFQLEE